MPYYWRIFRDLGGYLSSSLKCTNIVFQASRPAYLPPNTRDTLYHGLPPNVKNALRSSLQANNSGEEVSMYSESGSSIPFLLKLHVHLNSYSFH